MKNRGHLGAIHTQKAQFPINYLGRTRGVKLNRDEDQLDELGTDPKVLIFILLSFS